MKNILVLVEWIVIYNGRISGGSIGMYYLPIRSWVNCIKLQRKSEGELEETIQKEKLVVVVTREEQIIRT